MKPTCDVAACPAPAPVTVHKRGLSVLTLTLCHHHYDELAADLLVQDFAADDEPKEGVPTWAR